MWKVRGQPFHHLTMLMDFSMLPCLLHRCLMSSDICPCLFVDSSPFSVHHLRKTVENHRKAILVQTGFEPALHDYKVMRLIHWTTVNGCYKRLFCGEPSWSPYWGDGQTIYRITLLQGKRVWDFRMTGKMNLFNTRK